MTNSVDPDQTTPGQKKQSDLDLHCLTRPVCRKTLDHYGTMILNGTARVAQEYKKL